MKHITKTIIALSIMLSASFAANAQLYLGGGLSFGASNNNFRIRIAPDIGYSFSSHFAAGGKLSYESGVNRFGVTPYARLNILKSESPVRLMATLEVPFKWADNYSAYGAFLRPGLSVRVAERVYLQGHFGYFGWGSVTSAGSTTRGWQYTISTNAISIGVVVGL